MPLYGWKVWRTGLRHSFYIVSECNGFASARAKRGSRHRGPGGRRRIGVSTMLAGLLSPCLRRTEENLWGLPVISGQPSGLNGARASMRPTSIHRSTRMTSAAKFLCTAFLQRIAMELSHFGKLLVISQKQKAESWKLLALFEEGQYLCNPL